MTNVAGLTSSLGTRILVHHGSLLKIGSIDGRVEKKEHNFTGLKYQINLI